ncbi:MAG: 16S rRNA (guanine(527)-N(7))-methyltransferase RsmG [Bacteroidetes bacterium]|nr:16S rRNA (guanine(527)-N(7))-methyltransferase RsmG [Bacteroidota bacterium]
MSPDPDVLRSPLNALTDAQTDQLHALRDQLLHFNRRINLVSREDEAHLWTHHLVHCLALAARPFPAGSVVVDWGTGGGLPALPLAICFPAVEVHAVDAVGKKIRAVRAMGRRLGLDNLHPWHGRAEQWPGRAHYSVSRATAPLSDLWRWHRRVRVGELPKSEGASWQPGLLCLKGGDLRAEIADLKALEPALAVTQHPLEPVFGDAYFAEKVLVEVRSGDTSATG